MTHDHPTRLPIIDLSWAAQDDLARQLDLACRQFGFFYLVGHGIAPARIDVLMQLARTFFARSMDEKLRIEMAKGGRAWRGYFPVGGELTSGIPDRKEGLYFGAELTEDDPRVVAGLPLHGRNQFPDLPGFREAVLDYMAATTEIGHRLLSVLARGLGLAEDFFAAHYTGDPIILFRIFNYPGFADAAHPVAADSWSAGEHTDYGLLTLLKQDNVGGLQVRNGEHWIDVPDVPGSLVCNVGDMLERLTGGRYLSALHRARNVTHRNRMSLALFFDPAFDAQLVPIPGIERGTAGAHTQVRWDHLDPNAHVGTYGEYLLGKVGKVFPALKNEVLP
jgi:polar amino acid transport system ATP-binding protein